MHVLSPSEAHQAQDAVLGFIHSAFFGPEHAQNVSSLEGSRLKGAISLLSRIDGFTVRRLSGYGRHSLIACGGANKLLYSLNHTPSPGGVNL